MEMEGVNHNLSINKDENTALLSEDERDILAAIGGVGEFVHAETTSGAGKKTIASSSGIFLLINNMMGVGLPLLPIMFQSAGLVVPSVVILCVAWFSGLSASMLAESMKYLPNNRDFEDRIEYSGLAKFYLGKWPYVFTQVVLNLALLSLNLVSILLTVQVMDWTLVAIFKCTYGFSIAPDPALLSVCQTANATLSPTGNSPFPQGQIVVSLGYAVVIGLVIPMGYFNLDDNMIVQVIATIIQFVIIASWLVTCLRHGLHLDAIPLFGSGPSQGNVLGNIMLNYAFITTIPSWVNEKRRSSAVKGVIWPAVSISTLCYFLVGILGALSFPNMGDSDLLTTISNDPEASILDKISVYLFPLVAVASSIPIFGIIIRYNLVENKVLSLRWANFVSILLPWILVVPLTAGNSIFTLVSQYTSLAFQLPINLCVPFVIYALAMRRRATLKDCYCEQGPCEHDVLEELKAIALENSLRKSNLMGTKEQRGGLRGSSLAIRNKFHEEEEAAEQEEKWSTLHPVAARRCCGCFVSWMDKPEVDPLEKWSVRHPKLVRLLPERIISFLDDETPAPEHYALPRSLALVTRARVGVLLGVISLVLFAFAVGLSIWEGVLELQGGGSNSTNSSNSSGHHRYPLIVGNRKLEI